MVRGKAISFYISGTAEAIAASGYKLPAINISFKAQYHRPWTPPVYIGSIPGRGAPFGLGRKGTGSRIE